MTWIDWLSDCWFHLRGYSGTPEPIPKLHLLFMILGGLWVLTVWHERRGFIPPSERPENDDIEFEG